MEPHEKLPPSTAPKPPSLPVDLALLSQKPTRDELTPFIRMPVLSKPIVDALSSGPKQRDQQAILVFSYLSGLLGFLAQKEATAVTDQTFSQSAVTIASALGMTRQTVIRYLTALVRAGWLIDAGRTKLNVTKYKLTSAGAELAASTPFLPIPLALLNHSQLKLLDLLVYAAIIRHSGLLSQDEDKRIGYCRLGAHRLAKAIRPDCRNIVPNVKRSLKALVQAGLIVRTRLTAGREVGLLVSIPRSPLPGVRTNMLVAATGSQNEQQVEIVGSAVGSQNEHRGESDLTTGGAKLNTTYTFSDSPKPQSNPPQTPAAPAGPEHFSGDGNHDETTINNIPEQAQPRLTEKAINNPAHSAKATNTPDQEAQRQLPAEATLPAEAINNVHPKAQTNLHAEAITSRSDAQARTNSTAEALSSVPAEALTSTSATAQIPLSDKASNMTQTKTTSLPPEYARIASFNWNSLVDRKSFAVVRSDDNVTRVTMLLARERQDTASPYESQAAVDIYIGNMRNEIAQDTSVRSETAVLKSRLSDKYGEAFVELLYRSPLRKEVIRNWDAFAEIVQRIRIDRGEAISIACWTCGADHVNRRPYKGNWEKSDKLLQASECRSVPVCDPCWLRSVESVKALSADNPPLPTEDEACVFAS